MAPKLLVFDSHPVQYRVPVWQEMERREPCSVQVVYGSDCSVRGHLDEGFGQRVAWDEPLLEGYNHTILNSEKGKPLSGWGSLTGAGVAEVLAKVRPDAVLLTGLNYRYDWVALRAARRAGVPVWLRCETQDASVPRAAWKAVLRSLVYRFAYRWIDRFFYIGELNRQHYRKLGIPDKHLTPARYGTVNRFAKMTLAQKQESRAAARAAAGIPEGALVVGFSGKLIPKKNPDLLCAMLEFLPEALRQRTFLYFLGSGEMEAAMRDQSAAAVRNGAGGSYFAGFVNQTQMPGHYLAMDVMVLPSRRMGETWGLVANEAMQAGCGVVVSEAVGSQADFHDLERFRVIPVGDAKGLAEAVTGLAAFARSFDWADDTLTNYSVEATALAFLTELSSRK